MRWIVRRFDDWKKGVEGIESGKNAAKRAPKNRVQGGALVLFPPLFQKSGAPAGEAPRPGRAHPVGRRARYPTPRRAAAHSFPLSS